MKGKSVHHFSVWWADKVAGRLGACRRNVKKQKIKNLEGWKWNVRGLVQKWVM